MSRPRRSVKRAPVIESSDSEDEEIQSPEKKLKLNAGAKNSSKSNGNESSSSESDIENYLQPIDKLDFSSEFFNLKKNKQKEFDKIEKSDQENDKNLEQKESESQEHAAGSKLNFQQLQDFTKQIEEAKLQVEKYNAQNKIRENNHDVSNLLAAGESKHQLTLENIKAEDLHSSDFDTDDEWEDVKTKDAVEEKSIIPKENIEIRVGDMPELVKKKKGTDLLAAMKRHLNRTRKENQIYIHKVHLLCWIAHGNFLNSVINDTEILAAALSLLPSEKSYRSDSPDLGYLEQIVKWYKKSIGLTEKPASHQLTLKNSLKLQMKKKEVFDKNAVVLIFIAIMRALGIQCRLVLSFQVEPLRPPASELHSLSAKVADSNLNIPSTSKSSNPGTSKSEKSEVSKSKSKKSTTSKINEKKKGPIKPVRGNTLIKKDIKENKGSTNSSKEFLIKTRDIKEKVTKNAIKEKTEASSSNKSKNKDENIKEVKSNERRASSRMKQKSENESIPSHSENDKQKDVTNKKEQLRANEEKPTKRASTRSKSTNNVIKIKLPDQSRSRRRSTRNISQLDGANDEENPKKISEKEQKSVDSGILANKRKSQNVDSGSDSDYIPEAVKKKLHDSDSDVDYFVPRQKVKKRVKVKKEGGKLKVLSINKVAGKNKKEGVNIWVEVFLEAEGKWMCADLMQGQVHCVNELYMRSSHPVSYVVAWNNDNTLKDVSLRYCMNFNTVTRKLRVDAKWWEESLKPFLEESTLRSKEEDSDLVRQQLDQPLPKTVSEYKNHPLYALRRHLLKYEALYPDDVVPIGYFRGEPVYPRNSVFTCKSREMWFREAKEVKPGEEPYKVVKARPTYDRSTNTFIKDRLCDIFGEWQTKDYEPPTAENGIVPKNDFGNVDLFKTCMLPKGTVQLKLPGLNKICKKLNIDCAIAMVGYDFNGTWFHPLYDGFVVCKEFEDTCIAAWHQEQEEIERKKKEKIEKKVYANWKKLIKGLLITQRLKARYDFGGDTSGSGSGQKKASAKKRKAPTSGSESDFE